MSILDKRPLCAPLNLKLFAHIHSDPRLLGSLLQGNTFYNTTSYVLGVLKYLKNQNDERDSALRKKMQEPISKTQDQFALLAETEKMIGEVPKKCSFLNEDKKDEVIKEVAQKIISSFREKGSILIPGGWDGVLGQSGHAMCYKLQQEKDGSITFLVYNTGAGIQNHGVKINSKEKYIPVKAFSIPPCSKEALEDYIVQLMIPLTRPSMITMRTKENEKYVFDATRLYNEVISKVAFLGGKEIDPGPYCKTYTRGQISGTCTMRVLMPLLHGEMQGEAFQEFLYQLKLQSILDFYRTCLKEDTLKSPAVQIELRSALEKFSRSTKMLMERKREGEFILSKERGQESLDLIEIILKDLKSHEPQKLPKTINLDAALLAKNDKHYRIEGGQTYLSVAKPELQMFEGPKMIPLQKDPLEQLKLAYQVLESNDKNQHSGIILNEIEKLFLSFPISAKESQDFWSNLTREQAKESYTLIQNIMKIYGKHNYIKGGAQVPQQCITSYSALLTSSIIANQYFKEDKNFYCLGDMLFEKPFLPLERILREPFSVSMDPKFDFRLSQIKDRLKEIENNRPNQFQFSKDTDTEFYDIELINKHQALKKLNALGPPQAKNELDNARIYLYKLAKGELPESVRAPFSELISDLAYCTQFQEIQRECMLLASGNFDYFKTTDFRKQISDVERLKKLNFKSYKEGWKSERELKWINQTSNFTYENGTSDIPSARDKNTKEKFQIKNPILEELFFKVDFFGESKNHQSNEALTHFEDHSVPFTRIRSSTCRIIATVDFFDQNLSLLQDHDYQMLFQLNILTPGLLIEQLEYTPELSDKLVSLLENALKHHIRQNKIESGGLFSLKMACYLLAYLKDHPKSKLHSEAIHRLEKLESLIQIHIEKNKKIIAEEKVGQIVDIALKEMNTLCQLQILMFKETSEKENFGIADLSSILSSALFKNMGKAPNDPINDFLLESKVERSLSDLAFKLQTSFEALSTIEQNKIVREVLNSALIGSLLKDEQYEYELHFPLVKIQRKGQEDILVDLSVGVVKTAGTMVRTIPSEFYTQDFIQFFGNKPFLGEITQRTCKFPYPTNNFQVIVDDHGITHIQMLIKETNQWVELQDPVSFLKRSENETLTKLPRHFLEKGKYLWKGIEDKLNYYITDKELNFKAIIEGASKELSELDDSGKKTGYQMINPTGKQNDLSFQELIQRITAIESPDFLEIWEKTELKQDKMPPLIIRLPRYGVEFFAEKNEFGQWEMVWKENPNFKIKLEAKDVMGDFQNFLLLEQREHKIEKESKEEYRVLIPQQLVYTQGKQKDEYYELIFDQTNAASNALLNSKKIPIDDPLWKFSNESSYKLYNINSDGTLEPKTPEECLHLAYVYLTSRQPEKALDMLRLCKKIGGIKGNLKEVEWIKNIVSEIPAMLASNDLVKGTYEKARVQDPETLSVRLHALYLLCDFKENNMDIPMVDSKQHSKDVAGLTNNQIFEEMQKSELEKFYKNEFLKNIATEYKPYYNVLGNVPLDMQLGEDKELLILRSLYHTENECPIFLKQRFKELELINLRKEQIVLEKRKAQEKEFSEQNQTRLEEISRILKEGNKVETIEKRLMTATTPIVPLYEERLSTTFLDSQLVLLCSGRLTSSWGSWDRPTEKRISPENLNLLTDPKDFLYSFKDLYLFALEGENSNNKAIRQNMISYLENMVRMQLQAKDLLSPDLKAAVELSRVLLYVLKYGGEKWPRFTNDSVDGASTSLVMILRQCKVIYEASPIQLDYTSYSTMQAEKTVLLPPSMHIEPMTAFNAITIPIQETFNLGQELGVEKFSQAIGALEIKELSEVPEIIRKKEIKEKFLIEEVDYFEKDLIAGAKYNAHQNAKNKLINEYFGDEQKRQSMLDLLLDKKSPKGISAQKTNLSAFKEELLALANEALIGQKASVKTQLEIAGKERISLNFENLLFLYLAGDRTLFKQKTLLEDKEVDELCQKIHQYLLNATQLQQKERVKDLLEKIKKKEKTSPEYHSLLLKLGTELQAVRSYDPTKNPEILLFEYRQNMLVRGSQAKMIASMTEKSGDVFDNKIRQLIMGGGKSKVLLPILALKKANGTNLSIIEVPEALFKTNVADLNSTTQKLFGKEGYPFVFSRETNCESRNLILLHEKLKEVMVNRQYMITTAESVQCLELKYLELLKTPTSDRKEWALQVNTLSKILDIFKTRGDVIIDEVDMILDPKRELNFTLGGEFPIPEVYLKTFADMFSLLPKVELQVGGDKFNLQQVSNREKIISSESVWQEAMFKLATLMVQDPAGPLFAELKPYSSVDNASLIKYMIGMSEEEPKVLFEMDVLLREKISLFKGELRFLPFVLKKNQDENFGFTHSPTGLRHPEIAIPYIANVTPNEKAQFGTIIETILYTLRLQTEPKKKLSAAIIKEFIQDFKSRAEAQVVASIEPISIDQTLVAQQFFELTGLNLNTINLDHEKAFDELQVNLNKNQKVKDYCILNFILNNAKQSSSILRSDGVNHVSQYRSVQALTGTPWNYRCYHPDLSASFDKEESLGVDGQTFDLLMQKKPPALVVKENSPLEVIKMMYSTSAEQAQNIHALIDVGALFKGVANRTVAETFAEFFLKQKNSKIQHILFFNAEDELCALPIDRKINKIMSPILIGSTDAEIIAKRTGSNLENCFTYYDQKHTTGTDITQPINAIGYLTIDKDTTSRDYGQGAMRMRDLAGSQTIVNLVPQALMESRTDMTEWNIQEILKFGLEKKFNKLSDLHFQAALQQMNNVIREQLIALIRAQKTSEEMHKLYQIFSSDESSFFEVSSEITFPESLEEKHKKERKSVKSLFSQFGGIEKERNVADILQEIASKHINSWQTLLSKANIAASPKVQEKIESELQGIVTSTVKNSFEKRKHVPQFGEETSVEMQKEQEKEKELEKLVAVQGAKPKPIWHKPFNFYGNFFALESPIEQLSTPLNDMVKHSSKRPEFSFDDNIFVSNNYLNTYEGQTDKMDRFRKPIHFYLVTQGPLPEGKIRACIITQEEADEIQSQFRGGKLAKAVNENQGKLLIISPNDTVLLASDPRIEKPEYERLREQIRFMNGDVNVIDRNVGKPGWLSEQTNEKMEYLRTVILPHYPEKSKNIKLLQESLKHRNLFMGLLNALKTKNNVEFNKNLKAIEEIQNPKVVKALLNTKSSKGDTLYTYALKFGAVESLQTILKHPLLDETVKDTGLKAFQFACEGGPRVFEVLFKNEIAGFKNDIENWFEILHGLVLSKNEKAVEVFLNELFKQNQTMANFSESVINMQSEKKQNLFSLALEQGSYEIAALLYNQVGSLFQKKGALFLNNLLTNTLQNNNLPEFEIVLEALKKFPEEFQMKVLNSASKFKYAGFRSEEKEVEGTLLYGSILNRKTNLSRKTQFSDLLLKNPKVGFGIKTSEQAENFIETIRKLVESDSEQPGFLTEFLSRKNHYPSSEDISLWKKLINEAASYLPDKVFQLILDQATHIIPEKQKLEIFEFCSDYLLNKNKQSDTYCIKLCALATALDLDLFSNERLLIKTIESQNWELALDFLRLLSKFPEQHETDKWRTLLQGGILSAKGHAYFKSDEAFKIIYDAFNQAFDSNPKLKSEVFNGCGTRKQDVPLLLSGEGNPGINVPVGKILGDPLCDPNVVDPETGNTLLHYAIGKENWELVKLLLNDPRVNYDVQNKEGITPFMNAIKGRNVDVVKQMLNSGKINLHLASKDGKTAVELAGKKMDHGSQEKEIHSLIYDVYFNDILNGKGSFPSGSDVNGWGMLLKKSFSLPEKSFFMVLEQANKIIPKERKQGIFENCVTKLEKGISSDKLLALAKALDSEPGSSPTLLLTAIKLRNWTLSLECVKQGSEFPSRYEPEKWKALLIGALMSIKDLGSDILFKMVCEAFDRILDEESKRDILNENNDDQTDYLPLLLWAEKNQPEQVLILLKNPLVNPNVTLPRTENTLLHRAIEKGRADWVDFLLNDSRVNVNKKNREGTTPFMLAVKARKVETVKQMLETKRVDLSIRNRRGDTALQLVEVEEDEYEDLEDKKERVAIRDLIREYQLQEKKLESDKDEKKDIPPNPPSKGGI